MNTRKKMDAINDYYKIFGWDKMDFPTKGKAAKEQTGTETIELAYEHMEKDRKNGKRTKAVPQTPVNPSPDKKVPETGALTSKVEHTTTEAAGSTSNHTHNHAFKTDVSAPVINMHVPAPTVTIEANKFPGWFGVLAGARDAGLYMVLGAAVYATLGRKMVLLAGI
jgi:hypothetical protein